LSVVLRVLVEGLEEYETMASLTSWESAKLNGAVLGC
jgi:hypothetical protein